MSKSTVPQSYQSVEAVPQSDCTSSKTDTRRVAVGYVRVSTSMQAEDGLSLEAQRAAISAYCVAHSLRLSKIYEDVESGAKSDRKGLLAALAAKSDVFGVLKFDRLSRSIKHFIELYETYFSHSVELVAIREALRLDSALGRALVNILLVFAQMEREATGERTKEAIGHIRRSGYHFGKIPYGFETQRVPDNPRYRILVPNPAEQATLARIKQMIDDGIGPTKIAAALNAESIAPPQGKKWTMSMVYGLKLRCGWQLVTPLNARTHSDEEVKARMTELRATGRTLKSVANILNEEGYKPLKGKKFTEVSVCKLLGGTKTRQVLSPRAFAEQYLASHSEEKPSLSTLASVLERTGYPTPRGNTHWWPAQVRELLAGRFDVHYNRRPSSGAQSLAI